MQQVVDLSLPIVEGPRIKCDHGYELFGAVTSIIAGAHGSNAIEFGIHPISGRFVGKRSMVVTQTSQLVLRTRTENIPKFLPLSGQSLRLGASLVQLGVPRLYALRPFPSLRARFVTIKGYLCPNDFESRIRMFLIGMGVDNANLSVGKRRTMRIRDKEVVGFEVSLRDLTDDESLTIQQEGLGGRRRMSAGVFRPFKPDGASNG